MARRSGLGRGLSAIIPSDVGVGPPALSTLVELPVSQVVPNRNQPRASFDEESLTTLTASIRELGVLQPVLVRPAENDRFELIAGERRWRAARRAGLQTIPAIVREVDETTSLEQALVENLQRDDLNPLEEAAAYQQLIEEFRLTHEQVASRVGKSRAAISNTLRLFQLPPGIQRLVAEGRLSAGHARALLGTPDRSFQETLARRTVADGLSVRAVEDAVRDRNEEVGPAAPPADESAPPADPASRKLPPPGLLELEELFSNHLDTRVKVRLRGQRGRVLIEFADLEDLERLYRVIIGGRASA
ncbi:MAG: ParB/RepB/Spo0J family partition protein [Acidimicrobiales bacterium]